jgi:histidyl-tRNA synthetase
MSLIQPRTLKGFRDYLPAMMIPREGMMQTAREVFRSYGFSPIDTPVLEYLEILTGKGSDETDRQIYRFFSASLQLHTVPCCRACIIAVSRSSGFVRDKVFVL